MARRRFFVDEVRNGHAAITGESAHHLTRVLRVEAGQKYEISDNRRVWLAEVATARKSMVEFAVIEELDAGEEPAETTLYLALIKFERFEWAVEKANAGNLIGARYHVLFALGNRPQELQRFAQELRPLGLQYFFDELLYAASFEPNVCVKLRQVALAQNAGQFGRIVFL